MQTDATSSVAAQTRAGSVVALWRYPVKSMMGEELNSSEVTDRGLLGDRQFAVMDSATGKVGGAKNPRKWGNFFDFRATYAEGPKLGARISPVRITLPDGEVVSNDRKVFLLSPGITRRSQTPTSGPKRKWSTIVPLRTSLPRFPKTSFRVAMSLSVTATSSSRRSRRVQTLLIRA